MTPRGKVAAEEASARGEERVEDACGSRIGWGRSSVASHGWGPAGGVPRVGYPKWQLQQGVAVALAPPTPHFCQSEVHLPRPERAGSVM